MSSYSYGPRDNSSGSDAGRLSSHGDRSASSASSAWALDVNASGQPNDRSQLHQTNPGYGKPTHAASNSNNSGNNNASSYSTSPSAYATTGSPSSTTDSNHPPILPLRPLPQLLFTKDKKQNPTYTPPSTNRSLKPRPYICPRPHCDRAFARSFDLNRHVTTHFPHSVPKLDCPKGGNGGFCGRVGENGFGRQDHLNEHLRKVHLMNIPKSARGSRTYTEQNEEEQLDEVNSKTLIQWGGSKGQVISPAKNIVKSLVENQRSQPPQAGKSQEERDSETRTSEQRPQMKDAENERQAGSEENSEYHTTSPDGNFPAWPRQNGRIGGRLAKLNADLKSTWKQAIGGTKAATEDAPAPLPGSPVTSTSNTIAISSPDALRRQVQNDLRELQRGMTAAEMRGDVSTQKRLHQRSMDIIKKTYLSGSTTDSAKSGTKVGSPSKTDSSPFSSLFFEQSISLIDAINRKPSQTNLHKAAETGDVDILRSLWDEKTDLNLRGAWTGSGYGSTVEESSKDVQKLQQDKAAAITRGDVAGYQSLHNEHVQAVQEKYLTPTEPYIGKHMLRHEKPFKCEVPRCSKVDGFNTNNDLDRHKKNVHKIMPKNSIDRSFRCAARNCPKQEKIWPRLNNFRQHCLRIHQEEDCEELVRKSLVTSSTYKYVEAGSDDEDILREGPGRKSHSRSASGCATCKKRHIRCDESYPQCLNCTKHQSRCDYTDGPLYSNKPVAPFGRTDDLTGEGFPDFSKNSFDRRSTISTLVRGSENSQDRVLGKFALPKQTGPAEGTTAELGKNMEHVESLGNRTIGAMPLEASAAQPSVPKQRTVLNPVQVEKVELSEVIPTMHRGTSPESELAASPSKQHPVAAVTRFGRNSSEEPQQSATVPLGRPTALSSEEKVEKTTNAQDSRLVGGKLTSSGEDDQTTASQTLVSREFKWEDPLKKFLLSAATPMSILHAAFMGNESDIRLYLDYGSIADIEARSPASATPLMLACENLHPEIIDLLLKRGANVGATDKSGRTPLHHSLLKCSTNQLRSIKSLLSYGANIEARCNNGCTPLHFAIKNNNYCIVVFFLDQGADIEARDGVLLTPLHRAIDSRFLSIVQLLLDRGADASAINGDGDDALAAARHALRPSPEIIDLLIRNKNDMAEKEWQAALGRGGRKAESGKVAFQSGHLLEAAASSLMGGSKQSPSHRTTIRTPSPQGMKKNRTEMSDAAEEFDPAAGLPPNPALMPDSDYDSMLDQAGTPQSPYAEDQRSVPRSGGELGIIVASCRQLMSWMPGPSERKQHVTRLRSFGANCVSILANVLFPEVPVAAGKTRIRWTCSCGSRLYDDFLETRPGAAKELEEALDAPSQQRPSGQPSTSSNQSQSVQSLRTDATASFPTPSTGLPIPSNAVPYNPRPTNGRPTSTSITCDPESKWLLVCAQAWQRPTSLLHLNVCSMSSDQELFADLRSLYFGLKKAWWSRLSMKSIRSIRYVQFELHPKDLVDVRKVPDMPPDSRKEEYLYQTCDLIPPIGENLMTHLFHHPHEANEKAITFRRSPKKRKQRLAVCAQMGTSLGWGIHLVEGWAWTKTWLLALTLFLLSSLVFAIVWSVLKHDLQGAFSVAAYFVALVAFGIGTVQAYINQS